jgi:hypothetical protein
MATSYTSLLGFALPVTGELSGTWGTVVNDNITKLVEDSIAGSATTAVTSGDWTLSTTGSGAANEARAAILIPTGTPGVSRNIIAPSQSKAYIVDNQSNAAVVVKGAATSGATVAAGTAALVAWNGSDFVLVSQALANATGTLPVSKGGTGATTLTGVVRGTGTSALTAGNVNLATEVTGTLPVANGGTGITSLGTGVATFLGTPSSANLAAAVTDETGSGSLVFATSPVLTTPNLGTPSAATLTNATGLPIVNGTTGTLSVARGGTGQTSYTNGELLIGNTTGNTLAKSTLTAGSGVSITNGSGSITIAATGSGGTVTSVASGTGLTGGPITTTGTLSVATNGITNTLLRDSAALSVIGRSANSTGDPADIAAASDHQVLRRSGTAVGFGAVNLASTNAVTGTLPVGNGGTGITSLGTGVATFLQTPSSANLAAAVTNETGTGALVFGTTPVFVGARITVSALGTLTTGTTTLNLATAQVYTATITASNTITIAFSNAPSAGQSQVVLLRLTNAGGGTIVWPANTKFTAGAAPTLTASGVDVLGVYYDVTTTTYMVFVIGLDVKVP